MTSLPSLISDPLLGEGEAERDREGEGAVRSGHFRTPEEPDSLHLLPGEAVCFQRRWGRPHDRAQERAHPAGR